MSKTPTVKRIFQIIDYTLQAETPPVFTDIQKALAMPKSTLSGLLGEMVEEGILDFDQRNKSYHPGTKLILTSISCRAGLDIRNEITLVLNRYADQTDLTFNAGILSGTKVVYIAEGVSKNNYLKQGNIISLPAHVCSLGKVLLAQYTNAEVDAMYKDMPLQAFTNRTITCVEQLLPQLAAAREKHYATDIGEISQFVSCIAVPICQGERYIAAISTTVPGGADADRLVASCLPVLTDAKKEIEERLGGLF